ncbi:MAG TPA: AraC family ligand binding domain-containing protein [Nonomuraea sp.]|nr:AraC family ligand binding domain-containing protein [Nonomuraea sp.]
MDVHHIGTPPPARAERPILVGHVETQDLVGEEAAHLRMAAITFRDGARTRLHHHSFDQVLLITDGKGILASEAHQNHVSPGDVVFVPTGERHWHGAEPGASMTHVSITEVGETIIDE